MSYVYFLGAVFSAAYGLPPVQYLRAQKMGLRGAGVQQPAGCVDGGQQAGSQCTRDAGETGGNF